MLYQIPESVIAKALFDLLNERSEITIHRELDCKPNKTLSPFALTIVSSLTKRINKVLVEDNRILIESATELTRTLNS